MLGNIEWGYRGVKHNVTEYFVVWLLRAKLKICKSQRENQNGMKMFKKKKTTESVLRRREKSRKRDGNDLVADDVRALMASDRSIFTSWALVFFAVFKCFFNLRWNITVDLWRISLTSLQESGSFQVGQHFDDVFGHRWGSWQMITGGLETVFIGDPVDGQNDAIGIGERVRSAGNCTDIFGFRSNLFLVATCFHLGAILTLVTVQNTFRL